MYRTEKAAREGTIGEASIIAQRALNEQRAYTEAESFKVDFLLRQAELLGLGDNIPRDAAGLVAHCKKTTRDSSRAAVAYKGN